MIGISVQELSELLREERDRGVSLDGVFSKRRQPVLVAARARIAHRLRKRGLTYPEIGKFLGRDHSTIVVLLRRYDENGSRKKKARICGNGEGGGGGNFGPI